RRGERAAAVVDADLVLLHEPRDTARQAVRDASRARDDALHVELPARVVEAEVLRLIAQHVRDLGAAQQRLGRDAAPVEADAAQVLALDDRGREAELGGADRRDVAARAAADDEDVERCVGHVLRSSTIPTATARRAAAMR